ncbi:MAG TPA: MBL fold metallo-hydrolase, partial [Flavobacteriales bacterium]|nr:MBL fold metallo-hydrolase [Flavobacteriales bacterium]
MMDDFGIDVIGSSILICYDQGTPIISTDPWIDGSAYFGSWKLPHEVPAEQKEAIFNSKYLWFSHGHPDHLNPESIKVLLEKGNKVLLPDHFGGRISKELKAIGFDVAILPDRKWINLSEKIKVLCIADINQDAILLIDIDGKLFVNLNDAFDYGWGRFVRREILKYKDSFLLTTVGHGEATHVNYYDKMGKHDHRLIHSPPLGVHLSRLSKSYKTNHIIPFSTAHKYQRKDSIWANKYIADNNSFEEGYNNPNSILLPAYVRYHCTTGEYYSLNPKENPDRIIDPIEFGDDPHEMLEQNDVKAIKDYFTSISHLSKNMDFINVKVGGVIHTIELRKRHFNRGVTFECPRNSFMAAIHYKIFDDLLIGNFMKTTLHGKWPESRLYPDFTPYVTKYADNGLAKSEEELYQYFSYYKKRAKLDFVIASIE